MPGETLHKSSGVGYKKKSAAVHGLSIPYKYAGRDATSRGAGSAFPDAFCGGGSHESRLKRWLSGFAMAERILDQNVLENAGLDRKLRPLGGGATAIGSFP